MNFPHGTGPSNSGYDVALIDTSGKVLARAHSAVRSFIHLTGIAAPAAFDLPEVSMSGSRVYYLDGDGQVLYLTADGTGGPATRVPGGFAAHAAFAVSPDDRRIAVSVLDYSRTPASVRLYVEDLAGANHVDLYSSTSNFVWPVGWHNGRLVLAAIRGAPYSQAGIQGNPYNAADSYHVVDATNAQRLATLGSGGVTRWLRAGGASNPGWDGMSLYASGGSSRRLRCHPSPVGHP